MTVNLAYFTDTSGAPSSPYEGEIGEVCIANISPLERRKRLMFAIWQLIITLVILGILIALDLNPLWRLPLLFLFSASTVSYFQARDKT
jgi:hypothetical protein